MHNRCAICKNTVCNIGQQHLVTTRSKPRSLVTASCTLDDVVRYAAIGDTVTVRYVMRDQDGKVGRECSLQHMHAGRMIRGHAMAH